MNKKVAPNKVIKASEARQDLRDKLLGHAPKPKRKLITLFGSDIELQQPTLRAILDAQKVQDDKARSVDMIIGYTYVPGTNEKVFEPADSEVILNWPFDKELLDLQLAVAELTGVDIQTAEQELKDDPLEGQS